MRVGIDAGNFARDRRGMGRVARAIALAALDEADFYVRFLVERERDAAGVRDAFLGRNIEIATPRSAAVPGAYDVVWFPWNGMRYGASAPTLLTINDTFAFAFAHREFVARWREQRPIRRGAKRATQIVAPSAWSRDEIVRTLGRDAASIAVVPYDPDPFFVPGDGDDPLSGKPYAMLVGVREHRKNARVAIDAASAAFRGDDTLVVVGELAPGDRRRIDDLGLAHVCYADVDDAALRALYRHARAVLVPSLAEGFGLVAVEAMACGAATVAAEGSALSESTRGGALLVPPRSTEAWSVAIDRMLHDAAFNAEWKARGATQFATGDRTAAARAYLALMRNVGAS